MFKLNDTNIFIGQIKQILKDFNLPKIDVLKDDDIIHSNTHYIKNNSIYLSDNEGNLKFIRNYAFNDRITNITTNIKLSNSIYDTYTHRYLGRYLRFLRDYKNVDLMSMYNCFDEEVVSKSISIPIKKEEEEVTLSFNNNDSRYTIYRLPIHFNQTYTIGLNSSVPIEMCCAFLDNDMRVIENFTINNNGEYTTFNSTISKETYFKTSKVSKYKPFLYTKLKDRQSDDLEYKFRDNLFLLIKVPLSNDTSIVILEGDYNNCYKYDLSTHKLEGSLLKYKRQLNQDTLSSTTYGGSFDYRTMLELLSTNNTYNNYLLSSRLIEYLTNNAITPLSEGYDIVKIQSYLILKEYVEKDTMSLWSEEDRQGIYKIVNDYNLNSTYYDVLSYVDKEVERVIGGLE